ncbi:hypothetical protein ACJMK2_033969 [Sinanodonta woodiana]|uniref:DUF4332 domain-containing protein n=1 Tax=Sinanodonta woodiana TaxID=1069815 RepID=A0ABD3WTW9_SINWO
MAGKKSVVELELEGFVTNIQQNLWLAVNDKYEEALNIRSQKLKTDKKKGLLDLDKWYQSELPEIIQARSEKYITKDELCKLMKWKLTRGKFRPRLTELVQTNTDSEVEEASKKSFKKLPNLDKAINDLTVLKAIGPATASAVLAAGAPEHAAFMADESMMALPGLQPISYNLKFYLMYMDQVKAIVRKLNEQGDGYFKWTPHKVEITLWTYQIGKTLDDSIFKGIGSMKRPNDEENVLIKKKAKR